MNSAMPLVSVVIPSYNHELFIKDSIQGVIDQTYQNIELIIIDDGSTDASVEIIRDMIPYCKDRFVRFEFRYRENMGLSQTLNEALEWCNGKYFSSIASDDIMLRDKTEAQVDFLEKNLNIVAVSGGVQLIDELNNKLEIQLRESRKYTFKEIIMHKFHLPAPSQMMRLESIRLVGGYNKDVVIEDWYMWLKLSEIGKIQYLDEVFAFYRHHDNNFSKNTQKMLQGREDVIQYFSHSKYYEQALKKIRWLNTRDHYYNSDKDKVKWLKQLYAIWPTKTLNMLINEAVKKIMKKQ